MRKTQICSKLTALTCSLSRGLILVYRELEGVNEFKEQLAGTNKSCKRWVSAFCIWKLEGL